MVRNRDEVGRVVRVDVPPAPMEEARLLPPPPPAPRRRRPKWILVVGALVAIGLGALLAFFLTRDNAPTATRGEQGAAQEAEGDSTGLQITTASGSFMIADVVIGDRHPEGCADTDPSCQRAVPGYQVVVVELIPQGDANVDDITSEGTEAYLISSDTTRTNSFLYGWSTTDDDIKQGMVGFTPADTESGFVLHWPGNDPIDLGV